MRIIWRAFTTPKYGNVKDENEDAYWPRWREKKIFDIDRFSFALADGATQTSFSSLWAKLLVHEVGKFRDISLSYNLRSSIKRAQFHWRNRLDNISLPWHAQEKVKQGSFATILKANITGSASSYTGRWQAVAIGDTCIFHVRVDKLVAAHPIRNSKIFGNNPVIVSSLDNKNHQVWADIDSCLQHGLWLRGDHFFVMTDALAMWFLSTYEQKGDPISQITQAGLNTLASKRHFNDWVTILRQDNLIKNDDTTLIWLTVY